MNSYEELQIIKMQAKLDAADAALEMANMMLTKDESNHTADLIIAGLRGHHDAYKDILKRAIKTNKELN